MAELICPQCKTPNRVSARFCADCGAPLISDLENESSPQSSHPTGASTTKKEGHHEIGAILSGRYQLDQELGRGGFGAVYEAWDLNLNRRCAVKENLDASPDAFRQFSREASILANLSHPNLPRVTDHFAIPGKGQYLVMDFVEGDDLEKLLKRVQSIPMDQALFWIFQVMDALEYLHEQPQPVIHRDVKPANIRVTPKGKAMLVDFGLVKLYDPNVHTTLGARAVTPGFAPPEQYGKGKTDVRTDIYALGATLYTILTGSEPIESVQRMLGESNISAHQANSNIPPLIGRVIDQAMALDPSQRFQTIIQFKAALQLALAESSSVPGTEAIEVQPQKPIELMRPALADSPPITSEKPLTQKRASGRGLPIAGVSILVLICLGLIGILSSVAYNNAQAPARITGTAGMQQTQAAQIYATQTTQAKLISGLSPTQISETLMAQPHIPAWPVRFSDDFINSGSTFWQGEDTSNPDFEKISAVKGNGFYRVQLQGAKRQEAFWWVKSPQLSSDDDFILTSRTSMSPVSPGILYGLVFYVSDQDNRYYLFWINQANEFGVRLVDNGVATELHLAEKSPWISADQNELTVWVQPGAYQFFINGNPVATVADSTLTNGIGGLYFSSGPGVSATFDVDHIQLNTP